MNSRSPNERREKLLWGKVWLFSYYLHPSYSMSQIIMRTRVILEDLRAIAVPPTLEEDEVMTDLEELLVELKEESKRIESKRFIDGMREVINACKGESDPFNCNEGVIDKLVVDIQQFLRKN